MQLLKKNEEQMKKELRIKQIKWEKTEEFEIEENLILDNKEIVIYLKRANN